MQVQRTRLTPPDRAEMKPKEPNSIDAHVGQRIRLRRLLIGMSQERFAGLLGLTFQQIQKYETGRNRISAGRLFDVAGILGISVSCFFEGAGVTSDKDTLTRHDQGVMEFLTKFEGRELNAAFMRIKSSQVRRSILELVRSIETSCDTART